MASPRRDLPIRPGERSRRAGHQKLPKANPRARGERSEDPDRFRGTKSSPLLKRPQSRWARLLERISARGLLGGQGRRGPRAAARLVDNCGAIRLPNRRHVGIRERGVGCPCRCARRAVTAASPSPCAIYSSGRRCYPPPASPPAPTRTQSRAEMTS